jgi:drug/metabolite transporter (DMT)-like permease
MLAYYCGPASAIFMLWGKDKVSWPSKWTILKACGIAFWDISAQTLNYTGASLAGPTIFAIVYSSVTIWAALFSQAFLSRRMDRYQWMAVTLVFGGLALTATDSGELGPSVIHGLIMVFLGSSMHGLFYVMSEAIMTTGDERLSVEQNCAIQGLTATTVFLIWQLVYTLPNVEAKIWEPMEHAGTSASMGLALLVFFAAMSFLHSITFYHTLRYLSGGSTSAGVVKGLQAVLVFVFTHFLYCGHIGGTEMCFSAMKLMSLITVSGGVFGYGVATNENAKPGSRGKTDGYEKIEADGVIDIEPI